MSSVQISSCPPKILFTVYLNQIQVRPTLFVYHCHSIPSFIVLQYSLKKYLPVELPMCIWLGAPPWWCTPSLTWASSANWQLGPQATGPLSLLRRVLLGLSRWHSGTESACQCRRRKRCGFDPWVRKIPW